MEREGNGRTYYTRNQLKTGLVTFSLTTPGLVYLSSHLTSLWFHFLIYKKKKTIYPLSSLLAETNGQVPGVQNILVGFIRHLSFTSK